jgi:hypothetical protein
MKTSKQVAKTKFYTRDFYLAAFLAAWSNRDVELRLAGGNILFVFQTDDWLYDIVEWFYSNPRMCLLSYITDIERLKSKIDDFKRGSK